MKQSKTIVLTGGGTAGHITPNLALCSELEKHFQKIVYVGSGGMEKQLAKDFGLEFKEIPAVKLVRSLSLKNLKIPFLLYLNRKNNIASYILYKHRLNNLFLYILLIHFGLCL